MSIAFWCVFIAAMLPYAFTILAKTRKDFDNRNPREYFENLKGWQKRAHWVQVNSFEAFPAFAVGVIIASINHASPTTVNFLAIAFICARILYGICYLANTSLLRTFVWGLGFISIIGLFLAAAGIL